MVDVVNGTDNPIQVAIAVSAGDPGGSDFGFFAIAPKAQLQWNRAGPRLAFVVRNAAALHSSMIPQTYVVVPNELLIIN